MRYFLHEPGAGIQLQWQRARRIHCHNQWVQQKARQSEWLGKFKGLGEFFLGFNRQVTGLQNFTVRPQSSLFLTHQLTKMTSSNQKL
jgi:hypothetical protein